MNTHPPTPHAAPSIKDGQNILGLLCGKDRKFKNYAELARHMDVSATSICNWKKRGLPQKRLEELLTEFPSLADFLSQVRFEPTVDKQIAFIESDIRKLIEAVGALLVGVSAIEARFGSYITHARVKK